MMKITEDNIHELDFDKGGGLVPAIIQHAEDKHVLMQGYMNAGAIISSLQSGRVTFYSRSKERLWTKGETSGHYLVLKSMLADCDMDCLLVSAMPVGPVCHTGDDTCFGNYNELSTDEDGDGEMFLHHLYHTILDRKNNPKEGSYTHALLSKGINKVAQKVGEEAVELVIEAKDDNKELFLNESADLLYHFLVLLVSKGYTLKEVEKVLMDRHKK